MVHPKCYKSGYPRPQLVRKNFKTLNGKWFFIDGGDPDNIFLSDQSISVPFPPEYSASGIGKRESEKYVTYGRYVNFVKTDRSKRIFLHFEGVDYSAELFVNGKYVGKHSGAYTRWSTDITDAAQNGRNKIVVRVYDRLSAAQVRGKQRFTDKVEGCHYIPYTGIWKTVWTETVGKYCIRSLVADTSDNTLTLDVTTDCERKFVIAAEIKRGETRIVKKVVSSGNRARIILKVPDVEKWSADDPALYDLRLVLAVDKQIVDRASSYVGFRDVETSDGKITVNRRAEYLKMILDQGYWEETGCTPPDEAAIRRDVELIKAMGFNGVRKHQKIEDERYLYYCDVLGLYVWCEMPSMYELTETSKQHFLSEWAEIMELNRSHPSVIAWVPFNESWGVGDIAENRETQKFVDEVCEFTRSQDRRPVISNDGWEHTVSDILTIHQYEQDAKIFAEGYDFEKTTCISPLNTRRPYCDGYSYRGEPIIFSEFGGCSFKTDLSGEDWGYGDAVETQEQFAQRFDSLIDAISRMPYVCGWCYTQLTDVQQEKNGLLRIDRTPKIPIETIRRIVEKDRRR